ncbi:MAG: R3H domain-containing nucleic acid-binding protein [Acidobacteriota bacterium]
MTQIDIEQTRSSIERFVDDLIDKSSLDMRAETEQVDETTVRVSFQGFDLPLLLGHSAELLDAFQYIARRAFADAVAAGIQIDFDAGGYRTQRRQELELMAQKAAERVRVSKVPFVFDPMNAQDRRIIHLVLVEEGGVRTESEGDGQMRRVKILPG